MRLNIFRKVCHKYITSFFLFLESSVLHYGSDLDTSSQVGSTMSWQRTVRHMRPDINCAPSQHRTICIDNMEVGFKILRKKKSCSTTLSFFFFFSKASTAFLFRTISQMVWNLAQSSIFGEHVSVFLMYGAHFALSSMNLDQQVFLMMKIC